MAETPSTANTERSSAQEWCQCYRWIARSSTKRRRTRCAPSEVAKAEAVRDRVLLAKRTQFPPAKSTPAACVQYRMLLSSSSTTTVMDPVYASGSAKAGAMRTRGDFFAKRTQYPVRRVKRRRRAPQIPVVSNSSRRKSFPTAFRHNRIACGCESTRTGAATSSQNLSPLPYYRL